MNITMTYVSKDFTKEDEIYAKCKTKITQEAWKQYDGSLKRQIGEKRE